MIVEPTLGLALLAGLVSFISPCVLPLVPAYIGYMSGRATEAAGGSRRSRLITFTHGIFFVLGFTLFFVGFGLLTSAAANFLETLGINIPTILTRLGGVAVILFGLYVMKALDPIFRAVLRLSDAMEKDTFLGVLFTLAVLGGLLAYFLWVFEAYESGETNAIALALLLMLLTAALFRKPINQASNLGDFWRRVVISLQSALLSDTRRLEISSANNGYWGSLGIGVVFAAGWTPCIGPVYGSVLNLAAEAATRQDSLLPAASLLTAYSLGLGIPFLAMALAFNQLSGVVAGLKRNMRKVELVSGGLLIFIGVAILTGQMARISQLGANGELGAISTRLEACTAGAAQGRIYVSTWPDCIKDGSPKLEQNMLVLADFKSISETTPSTLFTPDPNFDAESVKVGLMVGERAPDFTVTLLDGSEVLLSDYHGQIVLLNFWATWCGPCAEEMPAFESIYQTYGEKGFTVLAVDFLEPAPQVQTFVDEKNLSFPIGLDTSGKINDLYQVRQYPTSYLIDGHGVITAYQAGTVHLEDLNAALNAFNQDHGG